jgi:hypothetical protein
MKVRVGRTGIEKASKAAVTPPATAQAAPINGPGQGWNMSRSEPIENSGLTPWLADALSNLTWKPTTMRGMRSSGVSLSIEPIGFVENHGQEASRRAMTYARRPSTEAWLNLPTLPNATKPPKMTSIRSEKLWGIMRSEKVTRGPRAIRETNRPPNPAIILLMLLSPITTPMAK